MWLKKREYTVYVLLRRVFGKKPFNIGDAITVLTCIMPRLVAFNCIKRLYKLGLLKRVNYLTYTVLDEDEVFNKLILPYLEVRIKRALKSRGVKVYNSKVEEGKLMLEVDEIPEGFKYCKVLGLIVFRLRKTLK